MLGTLYNTDILTLSSQLRDGRLDNPDGSAREVSKLCGSELEIDVKLKDDQVSEVALRVQACALGQSSAAILQDGIIGASLDEIMSARDSLYELLKGDVDKALDSLKDTRFEKLTLLEGVRAYPMRHISTLLAFEAAVKAVTEAIGYDS